MAQTAYANRGRALEDLIKLANASYLKKEIASIQKIDTPKEVIRQNGKISGAFYREKSTLDFIGLINPGQAITFDAKQTELERFPLYNVKQHQIDFMDVWWEFGGQAFLVVEFTSLNETYRLDYVTLKWYWQKWKEHQGERGFGSIPLNEFQCNCKLIAKNGQIPLDYLAGLYQEGAR
jgi:recombination protein U